MSSDTLIYALLTAAIAYPLIMRWLAQATHPSRLEMADIGRELLVDPNLNQECRTYVSAMLSDAFSPKIMAVLVFVYPVYATLRLLNLADVPLHIENAETAKNFESISRLHTISIAAANPIFSFLLLLQVMFFAALFAPFSLLRDRTSYADPLAAKNDAMFKIEGVLKNRLSHA